MSREQQATVWEMWSKGFNTFDIAELIGTHESAIYNFMYFSKGRKVAA